MDGNCYKGRCSVRWQMLYRSYIFIYSSLNITPPDSQNDKFTFVQRLTELFLADLDPQMGNTFVVNLCFMVCLPGYREYVVYYNNSTNICHGGRGR